MQHFRKMYSVGLDHLVAPAKLWCKKKEKTTTISENKMMDDKRLTK